MASGMTSSEEFYTAGYSALSHAEASPGFSFRENSEVTEDSETECDLGLGQCTLGVSSEENCMSIEGSKGLLAGDTKIAVDGAKYGSFSKTCQKRASEKSYDGRSGSRTEIAGESIGSCLQEQKNICRKDLENVFIHKLIDEIQQESSKFGDQGEFNIEEMYSVEKMSANQTSYCSKYFGTLVYYMSSKANAPPRHYWVLVQK